MAAKETIFGFCDGQSIAVEVSAQTAERFRMVRLKAHGMRNSDLLAYIQERLPKGSILDDASINEQLGQIEREWGLASTRLPNLFKCE